MFRRGGRSPYGERGLKFDDWLRLIVELLSLSLRRAWIEIDRSGCAAALWCVSASWHPQYRHYFSAA